MAFDFASLRRKLLIAVAIIVVLAVLLGSYLAVGCYSEGERAGNVIKFSHKGFVFKTWEGELMQRPIATTGNEAWHFSVANQQVADDINNAMAQNKHVVLHYCQRYYAFFWQGETQYFIDKVVVSPN